jgi:CHAT domain
MPLGLIELVGSDIFCSVAGGVESRFALAEALPRLRQWSRRYEAASARDREGDLAAIGQEMFGWLDEAGWASGWTAGSGDRELEVRVDGAGGADEAALLGAPWELLAGRQGPLAADPLRLFVVARRVGRVEQAPEPQHSDLRLMFMASAPEGQVELDYEGEEAAILEATKDDERVHLIVEETGVLRFLRGRLATAEGSCEALHLSCHGDIDRTRGPVLMLETPEGGAERATPSNLIAALGVVRPQLVALSACRTAEMGRASDAAGMAGRRDGVSGLEELGARRDAGVGLGAGTEFTASFARQLVTQVANVLGWDGSVYDRDATDFAAALYGELGLGSSVPRAAAVGRRALLQLRADNPQRGRHWHLARVYLGPGGGGPLCEAGKPGRRGVGDEAQQAGARSGGDAGGVCRSAAGDPGGAAGVSRQEAGAGARHGGAGQVEPGGAGGEPGDGRAGGGLRALRRAECARRGARGA